MTSKERVRAALLRKKTDKTPATLQCVEATWEKLMRHFGVDTQEAVQQLLEIDTRILSLPPYNGPVQAPFVNAQGETEYTHPFGYRYINKWNGVEYNPHVVHYPMAHIDTLEKLAAYTGWPNADDYDYTAVAAFCDAHPDKAICIGWPGPYQVFTMLYPAEEFYALMIEDPALVHAMLDQYCACCYEIYRRMLEAADGRIDILCCCDDYGTQRSLLFSPAMWDEFFAENTRRLVQLCHAHGCFYMQHSCGAVRAIIPNLLRCGVDALEPIQKVAGMETDGLQRDFGDKLCFQGGVDTQGVLPFGTPTEVTEETRRVLRTLGANGGYILAPSQAFEGDVPVENILALYAARQ